MVWGMPTGEFIMLLVILILVVIEFLWARFPR